jgi:hypothetical protein
MDAVWFFFGWITSGVIGGLCALPRGGSVGLGFVFGMLFGPIGWAFSLLVLKPSHLCAMCRSVVAGDARKCAHCGHDLRSEIQKVADRIDEYPLLANARTLQPAALMESPDRAARARLGIATNESVTVHERRGDFALIRAGDDVGWVSRSAIEESPATVAS